MLWWWKPEDAVLEGSNSRNGKKSVPHCLRELCQDVLTQFSLVFGLRKTGTGFWDASQGAGGWSPDWVAGCLWLSSFWFTFVRGVFHSGHVFCVGVGGLAGGDCYLPVLPQQKVSKWTQNTLLSLWLVMAALCCSNEIRSQCQMKELHLLIAHTTASQKRNWWHHFGRRTLPSASGRISQVNTWTAARAGNTRVKWAEKDAVHFSSGWTSVTDEVH